MRHGVGYGRREGYGDIRVGCGWGEDEGGEVGPVTESLLSSVHLDAS